jgi:hypothetical protein
MDTQHAAGSRDTLRVVTGRPRNRPAQRLFGRQLTEQIVGTTYLERARALQTLGLQQYRAANRRIERGASQQWGDNRNAGQPCCSRLNIGNRRSGINRRWLPAGRLLLHR